MKKSKNLKKIRKNPEESMKIKWNSGQEDYHFTFTVRFTPINPRLFGESILLIFSGSIWATGKPNTNFHILIPRAFNMGISDLYSDQINSWNMTKHYFKPFIWPKWFFFAFKNCLNIFPPNIYVWVFALNHKETFR